MTDTTPIIVEQTLEASRAVVWDAITRADLMRKWYFEQIEDFRPEVGFETRFTVEHEGKSYRHVWRVTEVVPLQRLTYSWQYEGLPGQGSTMWELSGADGDVQLKLTNVGLHSFPQDDPAFSRESCQGGWRYFLGERLPAFLRGPA